jgi:hypothetical protein
VNCSHFEQSIDGYLDGVLDPVRRREAVEHVTRCRSCDAVVTSYQQAAALLKAAVADEVTAVDVSGLWDEVSDRLGAFPDSTSTVNPVQAPVLDDVGWLSRLHRWVGEFRPLPWGAGVVAAAAAVGFVLFSGGEPTAPERVARAKTKPVRIEALEVPSGYTVATWSRPRSRTRVIAINPASGYTVETASYSPR